MKMEFSMRFLAVMSLLLLVSMSTEMGGPPMADAQTPCVIDVCQRACYLLTYNQGCCGVLPNTTYCFCTNEKNCELTTVDVKVGDKTMTVVVSGKKAYIKEPVD
ncbi:uncharacterized protein LOC111398624 [Olea europaea var. sylvestris]|uniref:uncharacterized protein LOC111398624 n=1 Tax=Olea europaea var. sylvestris TaxID=158386 RepID=UPI000C1D4B9A|nr:uncharacterized protein LOC111398624 [Olea europaea var. sylvestris]